MSFSQRPFTATANLIGYAATSVGNGLVSTVAAVPEVTSRTGTALRAAIPGVPASGSVNPLRNVEMPSVNLPSVDLSGVTVPKLNSIVLPSLPQVHLPLPDLPEVSVPKVAFSTKGMGWGEDQSILPTVNMSWHTLGRGDLGVFGIDLVDEEKEMRDLSKAIDLDKLRTAFFKYAGPDERMDEEEFKLFTKKMKLSETVSESLWRNLDVDGNGIVDADEFTTALETMTKARAWLRFCPTCDFSNSCDYCVSIADSSESTPERFGPRHWNEHPDRDKYLMPPAM